MKRLFREYPTASVFAACLFLMLIVGAVGRAADPIPAPDEQVDAAEVARWGSHAQYIDGSQKNAETEGERLAEAALTLPPDDNHKWYVTVIGMRNCPGCSRWRADVKADQAKQANLGAYITLHPEDENHGDTKKSWSHYNYLLADDAAQKPFVDSIATKTRPVIVIQVPANGSYGTKGKVVFEKVYSGDPDKFAKEMTAAIRLYVKKLAEKRASANEPVVPRGAHRFAPEDEDAPTVRRGAYGQQPYTPPPKVDPTPFAPANDPVPVPFQIPPINTPTPSVPKPDADAPTPNPGSDHAIPNVQEAVVLVDGAQTAAEREKTDRIVERLKRDRPGLRTIIKDIRDAKNLNVPKEETPAVVITEDGKVKERLGGKLLPLLLGGDGEAPGVTVDVEFPFDKAVAALLSGGNIGAWITFAVAAVGWFIARRKANAAKAEIKTLAAPVMQVSELREYQPAPMPTADEIAAAMIRQQAAKNPPTTAA